MLLQLTTMRCPNRQLVRAGGFSLVEMLVVVTLAAMILIGALGVYQRLRADASVLNDRLDERRLSEEVLQRIAEDIDRIAAPGFDASVQIRNKIDNGFTSAQLILESKFYTGQPPQPRIFEQVIWQTAYDMTEGGLILYRMHTGLTVEDKVLEENKTPAERNLFIPTTSGLTLFKVEAVQEQQTATVWITPDLPKGIRISVSFAPLEEGPDGRWYVPEEKILQRTVAVNRLRPIAYRFRPKVLDVNDFLPPEESTVQEPNQIQTGSTR